MLLSQIGLQLVNGFIWGWIIALVSLGLSLVLGLLGIVNIAHGAFYMLGATISWYLIQATGNFWTGLIIAPLLVGILGLLVERTTLRSITDKPHMSIIATFGFLLIFQHLALLYFGGAPRQVVEPVQFKVSLFGYGYPGYRIFVGILAAIIIAGLWTFLHHTKYGRWIRAVRQDRELALSLGIPVFWVYTIVFGLGAFLAAFAGILASPIVSVSFQMGMEMLVIAFIVVIVGGVGSLKGAMIASLIFGELQGLTAVFLNPTEAKILTLVLMGTVLLLRPFGLYGKKA